MAREGKVYLVGAGPGPAELLTLKAVDLLKAADVIIYDRLIQEQVLAFCKPTVERIYMGKPLGRHDSRQEEIHNLLLRKANEGKLVVRLKGGDPFLFGRGGEEVEFLADHRVAFEVVPGVSSALAAPLSAGIAVTHRDAASSVAIVTGHEATKNAGRMDWQALSRMDTLVFLMVVHNIGRVSKELIAHGRDPATPAALIQMAFWPEEKVVAGTLADIAEKAALSGISPPATLVVGEVVRLREKLGDCAQSLPPPNEDHGRPPAPTPDQLFRLAVAGMGSKVLGWALSVRLFDRLEEAEPATSLAQGLRIDPARLTELLDCLVALGLLERTTEGYRNLELASIYLRTDSTQSLSNTVLSLLSESSQWEDISAYLRNGHSDRVMKACQEIRVRRLESVACLAAPATAQHLQIAERGRVLVSGWGGEAFRKALSRQWPSMVLDEGELQGLVPTLRGPNGSYDAVVLSGVLSSYARNHATRILQSAAEALTEKGALVLHDALASAHTSPRPETLLETLGHHLAGGTDSDWSVEELSSTLKALRFGAVQPQPLPWGTMIVTARKE